MADKQWFWSAVFESSSRMTQVVHGPAKEEAGGLARFYEHTKFRSIACISASRGENTRQENKSLTEQMKREIRSAGFGFIKILGRFIENQGTADEHPVDEEVCCIIGGGTEEDKKRLKFFVTRLGAKYKQESILFKPYDDKQAMLIDTVGENKGRETKIGVWHPNQIGPYFSVMKGGTTFVFKQEDTKEVQLPQAAGVSSENTKSVK